MPKRYRSSTRGNWLHPNSHPNHHHILITHPMNRISKKRPGGHHRRVTSGGEFLRQQLERELTSSASHTHGSNNNSQSQTEEDEEDMYILPQDRNLMMTNFEEWIKMATDNKINSSNSWNFGLIDYFHDLNVLKGQDDNINFQKASATLDGCVKIYSSRVDSVVTETGRLLSGLTQKQVPKEKDGIQEGEEGEVAEGESDGNDEEVDNDEPQKKVRNKNRPTTDTVVKFDTIKMKKLSEELNIDPLFKKTLAEFDESGAKALLLNTLSLDKNLYVVFDANTNNSGKDASAQIPRDDGNGGEEEATEEEEPDVDDSNFKDVDMDGDDQRHFNFQIFDVFFQDHQLESEDVQVCPSLSRLEEVLEDVTKAKTILHDVNNQEYLETGERSIPGDFGNDDFGGNDEFAFDDMGFDNNDTFGEADADDQQNPIDIIHQELNDDRELLVEDTGKVTSTIVDNDLMSYFDNTVRNNWNRDNWKIRSLKHHVKPIVADNNGEDHDTGKISQRKKKEEFKIDFMEVDEDNDEEEERLIFQKGRSTQMPQHIKEQLDPERESHYLLPDDMYFTSQQLTKLFTKNQYLTTLFKKPSEFQANSRTASTPIEKDELAPTKDHDASFWAKNYKEQEEFNISLHHTTAPLDAEDDYDDYDDGGFGFDDYGGGDVLDTQNITESQRHAIRDIVEGEKRKNDGVSYARVAKNVNVKALKDNLWKVIDLKFKEEPTEEIEAESDGRRKERFSDIVHNMEKLYKREERKDLSTSFCFISLLHLANEHGLSIESTENLNDLQVII